MTVRAALIGCGRVANHYVSILTLSPVEGLSIVAACDLDPAKAERIASALGASPYTDAATMLSSERPDLVLVLTPSGLHHVHARLSLEHGCHTLVEKPIALRPEHAVELRGLAASADLLYGVMFQNRWNPAVRALREAKLAGRFGRVVTSSIRLRWCRYQDYYDDGWHGTWAQDGGVVNQQAIHHVDALDWVCGPVVAVCATSAAIASHLEAEDTIAAVLRFDDGSIGTIEATTAARPRDVEASLSVVGTGGLVQVGGIALNEVQLWEFVDPQPGDETVRERCSQEVPTGYGLSHGPYLLNLVEVLESGGRVAPVSATDGIRAVELVHALYASVEQGRWVSLDEGARSSKLGVEGRT